MRIAIIEDERPARSELIYLLKKILKDVEIDEAASGSEGLKIISNNIYDLIFIDIHLGDLKGFDFVPIIKRISSDTKIIFSTAYDSYAMKAFELQVDDYILKPFEEGRLRQVLERLTIQNDVSNYTQNNQGKTADKICINRERESVLVDVSKIVYIETDGQGRGCIIHTLTSEYVNNIYLSEYEKKLVDKGFFRIHKSYLVNTRYIISIFPWENGRSAIRLKGYENNILPISREKMKDLRKIILI